MNKIINNKLILSLVAIFLVTSIFCTSSCSCSSFNFLEEKYTPYDSESYYETFESASNTLATATNSYSAITCINECYDIVMNITLQSTLITRDYFLDMTNEYNLNEYNKVNDDYEIFFNLYYNTLYIASCNEYIKDDLFDQEFIYELASYVSTSSNEILSLKSTASSYVSDYYTYSTQSYEVDGVNYNSNNFNTNGYDTANEYLDLLSQDVGEVLIDLYSTYNDIADYYGYDNYVDYSYKNIFGRDYYYSDLTDMLSSIKLNLSDLPTYLHDIITSSAPTVSTSSFNTTGNYLILCENEFINHTKSISDDMYSAYNTLVDNNLLISTDSINAYNGCFCGYIPYYELPFMYLYLDNSYQDVNNLAHEFGHFYNFCKNGNVVSSYDILESQAISNEFLILDSYNDIFGSLWGDYYASTVMYNNLVGAMLMGCLVSDFEYELFTNLDAYKTDETSSDGDKITNLFSEILVNYGLEDIISAYDIKYFWLLISHIYATPCYYISYTMSSLTAINLYIDSLSNRSSAIASYNSLIDNSPYYNYLDLLEKSNITAPFDTDFENLASTITNIYA